MNDNWLILSRYNATGGIAEDFLLGYGRYTGPILQWQLRHHKREMEF